MAITMACALFGALVYAVVFPAVLVTLVAPAKGHGPKWIEALTRGFGRLLLPAIRYRAVTTSLAAALLVLAGVWFSRQGADFVPRIFEGDAVVTIRRAPSIALGQART